MIIVLSLLRQSAAGLRVLVALTVLLGVGYPLFIWLVAQAPGLQSHADGSAVRADGRVVGSALLGQEFTDAGGAPLRQYFQPRPSTGDYDPTASGASNLGPESVEDSGGTPSLLSLVCARSRQVGRFDGVDGARPYCTTGGVGAVLRVFYSEPGYLGRIERVVSVNQTYPATPFVRTYRGVPVRCASKNGDYAAGRLVLVRGSAPADPGVPADAVTASGSGLDPDISPAYASIQEARVAAARGTSVAAVRSLVARYSDGRFLGFIGAPTVNVLKLNVALDHTYPVSR